MWWEFLTSWLSSNLSPTPFEEDNISSPLRKALPDDDRRIERTAPEDGGGCVEFCRQIIIENQTPDGYNGDYKSPAGFDGLSREGENL